MWYGFSASFFCSQCLQDAGCSDTYSSHIRSIPMRQQSVGTDSVDIHRGFLCVLCELNDLLCSQRACRNRAVHSADSGQLQANAVMSTSLTVAIKRYPELRRIINLSYGIVFTE